MGSVVRSSALLLLFASLTVPAHATTSFGEPFPLTNTRYSGAVATGRLTSNGQDPFLAWSSGTKIRITRLVEGERRVGRGVLDTTHSGEFDVLWTGMHFLVAAESPQGGIHVRLLDAQGNTARAAVTVATRGHSPVLTFNGTRVLLLFVDPGYGGMRIIALTQFGEVIQGPERLVHENADGAVASNGHGFATLVANSESVTLAMFDERGELASKQTFPTSWGPRVTLASHGTEYLAAWLDDSGGTACIVSANGTPGPLLNFVPPRSVYHFGPSSAWTGSGYTIAYVEGTTNTSRAVRVVHLDAAAHVIGEEPPVLATTEVRPQTSVLAIRGRTFLAWNSGLGTLAVAELPLTGSESQPAAYAAGDQTLLATVSSQQSTLVVWEEAVDGKYAVRAGLRSGDGSWTERSIWSGRAGSAAAATDGTNFAVVIRGWYYASAAIRLDAQGTPIKTPVPITDFRPTGIAWNGRTYAIVGERDANNAEQPYEIVAARFDGSGALSAPVVIRASGPYSRLTAPAIASDGSGFLAVWLVTDEPECVSIVCYFATGARGARLSADLVRLDATDLDFAPQEKSSFVSATWTGSEYLVGWNRYSSVHATFLTPSGAMRSQRMDAPARRVGSLSTAPRRDGGAVLLWNDTGEGWYGVPSYEPRQQVVLFRADGTILRTEEMALGGPKVIALAAGLPDGRAACVASTGNDVAPHHGSARIFMTVGSRFVPVTRPPDAPALAARLIEGRAVLTWSAPSQPVTGYRIEYRIGDGSWNEREGWFGPNENEASLIMPVGTSFRIRAWSDWGTSEYSAPTPPLSAPRKRRAVR